MCIEIAFASSDIITCIFISKYYMECGFIIAIKKIEACLDILGDIEGRKGWMKKHIKGKFVWKEASQILLESTVQQ